MSFRAIDRKTWQREACYRQFSETLPCTYGLTVQVEVGRCLQRARELGGGFFPRILFALTQSVHAHEAFCMGYDAGGNLGIFSEIAPSFTLFEAETESFVALSIPPLAEEGAFLQGYAQTLQDHKAGLPPVEPEAIFYVSNLPWISFSSFQLDLQKGYASLAPIFTLGKYERQGDNILLPLAIQVHHAVCDGFHVAKFLETLQSNLDSHAGV